MLEMIKYWRDDIARRRVELDRIRKGLFMEEITELLTKILAELKNQTKQAEERICELRKEREDDLARYQKEREDDLARYERHRGEDLVRIV